MTKKLSTKGVVYKDSARKQKEERSFFHYAIKEKMGELFRIIRKRNGLSQRLLDIETGISERTISDIETGKGSSLEIIINLFRYYHINNYATDQDYHIFHHYYELFIRPDSCDSQIFKTFSDKTVIEDLESVSMRD